MRADPEVLQSVPILRAWPARTRLAAGLSAALAVFALAACGGGGSDDPPPSPPNPPSPGTPPPPPQVVVDRIEAYDSSAGTLQSAVARKSEAAPDARGLVPAQHQRRVVLGPLPSSGATAVQLRSSAGSVTMGGVPLQIGQARAVTDTATSAALQSVLQWNTAADGRQRAAVAFDAEGARGVRLGVWVQALPAGAVLRFYGAPGAPAVEISAAELAAQAERNAQGSVVTQAAQTYWSPEFGGPRTTLEVDIPASASPAAVRLAVPRLSHYTRSPDEASAQPANGGAAVRTKIGESASCEVDVVCKPEYATESRSVARMVFVREGNSFLCTGTLLNDARSSSTPYFLTANHCISSQAEASSLTTDWFYRASACGSGLEAPNKQRLTGGATLLYGSASTDTTFLRLNNPAPAGALFAGTYFGGLPLSQSLVGLHHPAGDVQKVSEGSLLRLSMCTNRVCTVSHVEEGDYLTLRWTSGTTEGGSSGSGAFATLGGKRYVVGQLMGGTASCGAPDGVDYYGRFDKPYRTVLQQWLNPTR